MTMLRQSSGVNIADVLARYGRGVPAVAAPDLDQLTAPVAGMDLPMLGQVNQAYQPGFMDKMLGYRAADGTQFGGWGGLALGTLNGVMGAYTGMQQLGLFKDQLAQSKKQFDINFGAQQKLTNSRLEDRQRARVAAGGTAYQSVGDYMAKNGI